MSPKAYRVYVLMNAHDRYYVGLSENVSLRLNQHNAGENKWQQHVLYLGEINDSQ